MTAYQPAEQGFASQHDMFHNPHIDGPVDGCFECREALGLVCEECGNDAEGLALSKYEDPGDPSVGYGPITATMCDRCAEHKGLL